MHKENSVVYLVVPKSGEPFTTKKRQTKRKDANVYALSIELNEILVVDINNEKIVWGKQDD